MTNDLHGKKIAILATDGFEEDELLQPLVALEKAGAHVDIVSLKKGWIKGWKTDEWGEEIGVDAIVKTADAGVYDALVLPGGVMNPDKLRADADALRFVKHFVDAKKPIGAICHGPWTLIDAGAVVGRRMTSWKSLETDLTNAGAKWVDEVCVVDGVLVTSRKPDDLPTFNAKLIEAIADFYHAVA